MLLRRVVAAQPLSRTILSSTVTRTFTIHSQLRATEADTNDPGMNGGYENPPAIKRSTRDPYGDWWDKQERRNYGEPVHEDNDILGVFSTEKYTHFTAGRAGVLMGTFIMAVGGLCAVVYRYHPENPAVPRTFPNGLEVELGGKGALPARRDE